MFNGPSPYLHGIYRFSAKSVRSTVICILAHMFLLYSIYRLHECAKYFQKLPNSACGERPVPCINSLELQLDGKL